MLGTLKRVSLMVAMSAVVGACTMGGSYQGQSKDGKVSVTGVTTGSGENQVSASLVSYNIPGEGTKYVPLVTEGRPVVSDIAVAAIPAWGVAGINYKTATRVAKIKKCDGNCGTIIQNTVNPTAVAGSSAVAVNENSNEFSGTVGGNLCTAEAIANGTCAGSYE